MIPYSASWKRAVGHDGVQIAGGLTQGDIANGLARLVPYQNREWPDPQRHPYARYGGSHWRRRAKRGLIFRQRQRIEHQQRQAYWADREDGSTVEMTDAEMASFDAAEPSYDHLWPKGD